MNLSSVVNVIDCEYDGNLLLEVGLTEVDFREKKILKTYSYPISTNTEIVMYDSYEDYNKVYGVSQEIADLTGWTRKKLDRQGYSPYKVANLLYKRGWQNRLCVSDMADEAQTIVKGLGNFPVSMIMECPAETLNVSTLFAMNTSCKLTNLSLEDMLGHMGLKFEGQAHRASVDAYNIARLFLELIK
jgi:hypothetical protein